MLNGIFMILGKKPLIANNNSSKALYFFSSLFPPFPFHRAGVFRWIENVLLSSSFCTSLKRENRNFSHFLLSCVLVFSRLCLLDADVIYVLFFSFFSSTCPPNSWPVKNNWQTFTELISDHHSFVLNRIWSASSSEQRSLAVHEGELNLFCKSWSTAMLCVVQMMLLAGRGESAMIATSA